MHLIDAKLKGRVHCFSMQVVMNMCFLLILKKKIGADPSCRFREKRKSFRLSETMVSVSLKLTFNLLTAF